MELWNLCLYQDMQRFSYSPVSGANDIRVLRLKPACSGQQVRCELITTDLSHARYDALSYRWVLDRDDTHHILLDGRRKSVSKNLLQIFDSLRHESEDRFVWVDALCINQDDPDEKAQQVQHMYDIYKHAGSVVCWLGPGSADTKVVIDALNDPNKSFDPVSFIELVHDIKGKGNTNKRFSLLNAVIGVKKRVSAFTPLLKDNFLEQRLATPDTGGSTTQSIQHRAEADRGESAAKRVERESRVWKNLARLLNDGYWDRAWVQQEATGNANTFVQIGRESFPIDWLIERARAMVSTPGYNLLSPCGMSKVSIMRDAMLGQGRHPSFLELVRSMRLCAASDHRDLIYAARGMAHGDKLAHDIRPDYSISQRGLFIKLAKLALEFRPEQIDIIGYVAPYRRSHSSRDGGPLPSWVPDWRVRTAIAPFIRYNDHGSHFKAGFRCVSGQKSHGVRWRLLEDDVLAVSGYILDTIEGSCWTPEGWYMSRKVSETYPLRWSQQNPHVDFRGKYESDELSDAAFRRTLTADSRHKAGQLEGRGSDLEWTPHGSLQEARENGWFKTLTFEGVTGVDSYVRACMGRSFAMTRSGTYCLIPQAYFPGRMYIAAFQGHAVLHVLGQHAEEGGEDAAQAKPDHFTYLGECYLDGFMDGQALGKIETGEESWKDIHLV